MESSVCLRKKKKKKRLIWGSQIEIGFCVLQKTLPLLEQLLHKTKDEYK